MSHRFGENQACSQACSLALFFRFRRPELKQKLNYIFVKRLLRYTCLPLYGKGLGRRSAVSLVFPMKHTTNYISAGDVLAIAFADTFDASDAPSEEKSIHVYIGRRTGKVERILATPADQDTRGQSSPPENVFRFEGAVWAILALPDDRLAIAGESPDIVILDSRTFAIKHRIPGHIEETTCLALNRCTGTEIASVGGGFLHVIELGSVGKTRTARTANVVDRIRVGESNELMTVAWSPDGRFLATGGDDGYVYLISVVRSSQLAFGTRLSGSWRFSGHTDGVTSCAWVGNHTIVSGSQDSTIGVWDLDLTEPTEPTSDPSKHTPSTPSTLISTRRNITPHFIRSHTDSVNWITVLSGGSPGAGYRILSGSADNTIRLWDSKTNRSNIIISGSVSAADAAADAEISDDQKSTKIEIVGEIITVGSTEGGRLIVWGTAGNSAIAQMTQVGLCWGCLDSF